MELENLMQSLSLVEPEAKSYTNYKIFAATIGGHDTDIVVGEFTNKHLLIATQYGKIGSLLRISVDQAINGTDISDPVYSVQVVIGSGSDEQLATARFLAEKLSIRKPLLLFLCLKDYKRETVKTLADVILSNSGGKTL